MQHRHQNGVDDSERDNREQNALEQVVAEIVDPHRGVQLGHGLAPPHDGESTDFDGSRELSTEIPPKPFDLTALLDENGDVGDVVAGMEPLACRCQRDVNQRLIDLGHSGAKDTDDPQELARDLPFGVLSGHDES